MDVEASLEVDVSVSGAGISSLREEEYHGSKLELRDPKQACRVSRATKQREQGVKSHKARRGNKGPGSHQESLPGLRMWLHGWRTCRAHMETLALILVPHIPSAAVTPICDYRPHRTQKKENKDKGILATWQVADLLSFVPTTLKRKAVR